MGGPPKRARPSRNACVCGSRREAAAGPADGVEAIGYSFRCSRSRAEGDGRSGVNKVRHHLGNLAARPQEGQRHFRKRIGVSVLRAGDFGLRT